MVFFIFILILIFLYLCYVKINAEKHTVISIKERPSNTIDMTINGNEIYSDASKPKGKLKKLPEVKLNLHYIETSDQLFQKFLDAYERPSKKRKD